MSGVMIPSRSSFTSRAEGVPGYPLGSRAGAEVVIDFFAWCVQMGRGFNLRHGTISAPEVGDVLITDAKAEAAVAAASGTLIIPIQTNFSLNLAAATLFEAAGKSAAASTMTGGTAFVPLPLRTLGPDGGAAAAATSTAMVGSAGGVTVAAELATTTRRHWSWSQPIAAGAYTTTYDWNPLRPPHLVGPATYYVQIGADTTGPSYFLSIEWLDLEAATFI